MAQLHADNVIFGCRGEAAHALCELVGFEHGVEDAQVLRTSYFEAVEDHIENLRRVDKVAAFGHLLQVDAQASDALEARSHAFDGLEVRPVKVRQVAAGIRGHHDDVLGGHVQVEVEGAAALVHLLDEVLADAGEAEQGIPVAVEAVAREDEEDDVQEELGEGGEGVVAVHVWFVLQTNKRSSTCIFFF
jgi:hypothetical protein